MGGTLYLKDSGGAAGSGGMITFGATQGNAFAAIKGYVQDGSNYSLGHLVFYTRAVNSTAALVEAMRIDQNGRVGLGIAAPAVKLHVVGTSYHQGQTLILGDQSGGGGSSQLVVSGITDTRKALYISFDTSLNWGIIQAGISGVSWNALHLNPNGGNVGIGCGSSAPPQLFSVVNPTSAGIWIGNDLSNGYIITRDTGTGALVFYGTQSGFSGYFFDTTIGGTRGRVITIATDGTIAMPRLGLTVPPAGSYKLYIDSGGFVKVAT
jgi:hypothetical protein